MKKSKSFSILTKVLIRNPFHGLQVKLVVLIQDVEVTTESRMRCCVDFHLVFLLPLVIIFSQLIEKISKVCPSIAALWI